MGTVFHSQSQGFYSSLVDSKPWPSYFIAFQNKLPPVSVERLFVVPLSCTKTHTCSNTLHQTVVFACNLHSSSWMLSSICRLLTVSNTRMPHANDCYASYRCLGPNDMNKSLYLSRKDGFLELVMLVDTDPIHLKAKAG